MKRSTISSYYSLREISVKAFRHLLKQNKGMKRAKDVEVPHSFVVYAAVTFVDVLFQASLCFKYS